MINRQFLLGVSSIKPGTMNSFAQRQRRKMAIRRQNLERIFDQRRLAICEEIERTWLLKGASLQVHRRNLKCTHELRKRGLSLP